MYNLPDFYDDWRLSNGPYGDECTCEECTREDNPNDEYKGVDND